MKFEHLSIAPVADNNGKTGWWSKTQREQRMGRRLINSDGLYFRICNHFMFCCVSSYVLLSCHCGDILNVPQSLLLLFTVLLSGQCCYWTVNMSFCAVIFSYFCTMWLFILN